MEGQSAADLPKSMCAIGFWSGFHYLKTYSEHVLLSGKVWFGMNLPSFQKQG